ncbi:MAG: efflux RND transporter permease subunit [Phycisphaerae bacterium]|nr:efflux RND transporter permease subunit [Phycisphaerae bacterium]
MSLSLTRFTLKHRPVMLAVIIVLMVIGIVKFLTMPRRADPSFTIRTATVTTQWPGTDAKRVEQLVTFPLEKKIDSLDEVKDIHSTTWNGRSVINIALMDDLDIDLIQETWDKVRAKIDEVRPNLPAGVGVPLVNDSFGDTAVMLLAIHEKPGAEPPRYSMRDLEIIANGIQEKISLLDAVAKAEVHGIQPEVIYLETTRGNWGNLDITMSQLESLLQARNIYASGGSIETARARFDVQPTGEFDAISQIESIVVKRDESGAPIYLKDLGIKVRRGYHDPPRIRARFGDAKSNMPCLIVSFTMKGGQKVTDLGPQVTQLVKDLQQNEKVIPPDIAVDVVFDESVFVNEKISTFTINVAQAIAIVIAVALIMAGLRQATVMAAAIPFVVVISIGIFAMIGVELEQMAIASLIIALGMLVDNAVVVSDNIGRFQREGYNRFESVAKGVEQIQGSILMGTLTTVFAFLPMAFFLTGSRAEYIFSIPAVVSIALLTSLVLALTLTSLMAYWIIRPPKKGRAEPKSPLARIGDLINRLRKKKSGSGSSILDRYASLVRGCLVAKPLVLLIVVGMLVGAIMLPIGSEFFPDDNRDILYIDIWLPEGTSVEATNLASRQVEQILRDLSPIQRDGKSVERLRSYYASIGGSGPRFALGVSPSPQQSNFAQIIVRTTDPLLTDKYVADVHAAAKKAVPGARVIPRKLALGPPTDSPIAIRIFGSSSTNPGFADEAELRQQAAKFKKLLASLDGTWDIHDVWGDLGYQLDIDIDNDKANLAGVTNASVANSFSAYYSGHYLTTYREVDHTIPVYFRLPPDERDRIHDSRTIFVEGITGKLPVDSVADTKPRRTTTRIERRDKNRMIEVRANVESGILANDVLTGAMPKIHELADSMPPGYYYEIGGEQENSNDAKGEIVTSFGVGIVLIALCLIIQYNSFVKPFVVLLTVPMGAIGAFFGLWITGNPLGFMPMLGLVALTGIVINSGILYVEFADTLIRQKLLAGEGLAKPGEKSCNGLNRRTFHQCLSEAGKIRLLPIVLTASTTIGGLFTLIFAGPLWEGMAYLLIFGLMVATVLTLLVLPTIYATAVEYLGLKAVPIPTEKMMTINRSRTTWLLPTNLIATKCGQNFGKDEYDR